MVSKIITCSCYAANDGTKLGSRERVYDKKDILELKSASEIISLLFWLVDRYSMIKIFENARHSVSKLINNCDVT